MKHLIFLFLAFFFFSTIPSAEAAGESPNCILHVTSVLNTGKTLKKKRRFHLESEEECEDVAEQFRENFAPWRITKKEVKVEWID